VIRSALWVAAAAELVLIIRQLAADAVSWRVLLNDLDHSHNKQHAAATWKKTSGFHTPLVFFTPFRLRRRRGTGRAAVQGQRQKQCHC
jgi:hypothetical protein